MIYQQTYEILKDFEIKIDHSIQVSRIELFLINKKKRKCLLRIDLVIIKTVLIKMKTKKTDFFRSSKPKS